MTPTPWTENIVTPGDFLVRLIRTINAPSFFCIRGSSYKLAFCGRTRLAVGLEDGLNLCHPSHFGPNLAIIQTQSMD